MNNQLALSSHAQPGSLQGPTPEPTWSPSAAPDWGALISRGRAYTYRMLLLDVRGRQRAGSSLTRPPNYSLSWLSRGKQGVETESLRKDPGQYSGRPLCLGAGRGLVVKTGDPGPEALPADMPSGRPRAPPPAPPSASRDRGLGQGSKDVRGPQGQGGSRAKPQGKSASSDSPLGLGSHRRSLIKHSSG